MWLRRLARILEATLFLPLILFKLALVHAVRVLGIEWPFLESGGYWALSGEPTLSAWAALISLAVMALLLPEGKGLGWRRLLAAALLALATWAFSQRMPQVTGLWGLQVVYVLLATLRERSRRRREEAAAKPQSVLTGPSADDPLTLAAALAGVLLAAGATLAVAHWSPGLVLPLVSPTDRFRNSHRPLAASVVALEPGQDGGGAALVPHPTLTREQVLAGVREQGGGWTVGRVLERLERRKLLGALPPVEPAQIAALLGPADASGILRTRDERPALGQDLWGVVVEAEHWKGTRRALLSLGLGQPTGLPATRYELLLEWPAAGGTPRVLQATRFVARPSGFEGVEWPGIFLPLLLVCLLLTLGLALASRSRRGRDKAHPAPPPSAAT